MPRLAYAHAMPSRRAFLGFLAAAAASASAPSAHADAPLIGAFRGHPKVKVDRVLFPPGVADADFLGKKLKQRLQRAARHADWGAGRRDEIRFRFRVETLTLTPRANVLTVHCSALGELPKGKTARTRLTYSGDPSDPRKLVLHVLEIVASGVVARLADLERSRRVGA
jgi:hypothetical protein